MFSPGAARSTELDELERTQGWIVLVRGRDGQNVVEARGILDGVSLLELVSRARDDDRALP
jgi:hypothetical protein